MQKNVCGYDRVARVVGGVALLAVGLGLRRSRRGRWRRRLGGVAVAYGAELLLTALVQRCPTNALLGVNTCEQSVPEAVRTARERLSLGGDPDDRKVPIPTPT